MKIFPKNQGEGRRTPTNQFYKLDSALKALLERQEEEGAVKELDKGINMEVFNKYGDIFTAPTPQLNTRGKALCSQSTSERKETGRERRSYKEGFSPVEQFAVAFLAFDVTLEC